MNKDKVILVDCDGVLLDWEYSFDYWMKRHGYVKTGVCEYDMSICYDMPRDEIKRLSECSTRVRLLESCHLSETQ